MKVRGWRRLAWRAAMFFLISSCLSAGKGFTGDRKVFGIDPTDRGERRVIIGFKTGAPESLLNARGVRALRRLRTANAVAARLTVREIFALAEQESIAFIEPDHRLYATAETLPWGVDRIDAEVVHQDFLGDGATVAIIDTGIDYTHPDLNGNYLGGYDFVNDDADPMDDHGHGTHCAGIVAAEADGEGVIGVAPRAGLYALKVLGANGSGWTSDIIAAIEWAVEMDADVISMSLGGGGYSRALETACENAYASGVVLVAAAGNDYRGPVSYPAAYESVIAVSATDRSDRLADFSNAGPEIEIAAPGVQILSTVPNGSYEAWSGTSMATPHVSGVVALMRSVDPSLSSFALRERLRDTAEDLGAGGRDDLFGYGLVDAEAALDHGGGAQVTVRVRLQARQDHGSARVAVDGLEQLTPSDGLVTFQLKPGPYTVHVSKDGYLYAQDDLVVVDGSDVDLPVVTLLGGDATHDGIIDIFDLTLVGSAYGSSPPSDPRADINEDGRVDIFDLTLVGSNYGREAPGPW